MVQSYWHHAGGGGYSLAHNQRSRFESAQPPQDSYLWMVLYKLKTHTAIFSFKKKFSSFGRAFVKQNVVVQILQSFLLRLDMGPVAQW